MLLAASGHTTSKLQSQTVSPDNLVSELEPLTAIAHLPPIAFYPHVLCTALSHCKRLLRFGFLFTGLSAHLFAESLKVETMSNSFLSFQDLARCSAEAHTGKCWDGTRRMGDWAINLRQMKTHWDTSLWICTSTKQALTSSSEPSQCLFGTRGSKHSSELGQLDHISSYCISFI